MKATLVKDDNFKTIGLEIAINGFALFKWGISPASPFYWTKTISANDYASEIAALITLEGRRREKDNFEREFFDIAIANDLPLLKEGINFSSIERTVEYYEDEIKKIIDRIL